MAVICPTCGHEHTDATDADATRGERRYTYAGAARALGVSTTTVRRRIDAGLLRTVQFMGRTYVDGESVRAHLATHGYPDSDERRLAELLEAQARGAPVGFEIAALQDKLQRAADDQMRRRFGGLVSELYPVDPGPASGIPSAAEELLGRFGGGGR